MIRWSPRIRVGRQVTLSRSGARVGTGLARWFVPWPKERRGRRK